MATKETPAQILRKAQVYLDQNLQGLCQQAVRRQAGNTTTCEEFSKLAAMVEPLRPHHSHSFAESMIKDAALSYCARQA